jgi:hypothetical protein
MSRSIVLAQYEGTRDSLVKAKLKRALDQPYTLEIFPSYNLEEGLRIYVTIHQNRHPLIHYIFHREEVPILEQYCIHTGLYRAEYERFKEYWDEELRKADVLLNHEDNNTGE